VPSTLARLAFGDIVGAEWVVVSLGLGLGAAATAWCASKLSRSVLIGALVALLEVLASPRSYSYPKILVYAVGACVIVGVAERASRTRIVLAALLAAVAFLVRHDHGLYLGAGCAVAIALSAPSIGVAIRRLAGFGALVLVLIAPWAMAVQFYAGLVPYFTSAIAFSRREADITILRELPAFHLPLAATASNAEAWLFYLFYALPIVSVVVALWRRVTKGEHWAGESVAVGAISLVALLVNVGFLRNPLATRLPDATVPACLLGAWLLGLAWSSRPRTLAVALPMRALAAVVLALTAVAVWRVGDVSDKLDEVGIFDDLEHVQAHLSAEWDVLGRQEMDVVHFPSRVSAGLVPFFRYLDRCTAPTDRLLVSGSYPDVFVLARRGFAGGHIAFMQAFYSTDAEQTVTLTRMRRESVPFVLLVLDEQASFAGSFPMLLTHITSAYDVLGDVPIDGMQGVRVYVERERRPTGVDQATGWPCFT
jgi:hypothetical protein